MSDFTRSRFEIGETAVTIAADAEHQSRAVDAIIAARSDVKRHIVNDPFFLTTFEPYDCGRDASNIVRRMCAASRTVGVGPMATVAGAIAQAGLEAMIDNGCRHGWIDNGGDIALLLEQPVTVEVYCEPDAPEAFALEVDTLGEILGVCSSSGRLGHSISLGESDVSVAIADSAVLADAAATAIGNCARGKNDLVECFRPVKGVEGFVGGLAVLGGDVSMCGRVPRLVGVEHSPCRVTSHSAMSNLIEGESCHSHITRRVMD